MSGSPSSPSPESRVAPSTTCAAASSSRRTSAWTRWCRSTGCRRSAIRSECRQRRRATSYRHRNWMPTATRCGPGWAFPATVITTLRSPGHGGSVRLRTVGREEGHVVAETTASPFPSFPSWHVRGDDDHLARAGSGERPDGQGELRGAGLLVAHAEPANPAAVPPVRGGAARVGRSRFHAHGDRRPADLPQRTGCHSGRARGGNSGRWVALSRRHRGHRPVPGRGPGRARGPCPPTTRGGMRWRSARSPGA